MDSQSDTNHAIGTLTAQFKSKDLEHRFRQWLLEEDKKRSRIIISAAVIFLCGITWSEYRNLGLTEHFFALALSRVLLLSVFLVIAFLSYRSVSEKVFDRLVFIGSNCVVLSLFYITSHKQFNQASVAAAEVIIIWALYLMVPTVLLLRAIPTLILSLFSPSIDLTPLLVLHHVISHVSGFGYAYLMNKGKRKKYLVYLNEANLNEKLKKTEHEVKFISERLAEQNKLWKDYAMKDPLTGLFNRRAFTEHAEEQWSRAVRNKEDSAVILFDIDHFKTINDSYGHPTGDLVLKELTALIKGLNRAYDKLGRWGGEEFIMFIPDADSGHAEMIGERMRKAVCEHTITPPDGTELKITISVGVASKSLSQTLILDEVINQADKALYTAKMSGRNRVCIYSETPEGMETKP